MGEARHLKLLNIAAWLISAFIYIYIYIYLCCVWKGLSPSLRLHDIYTLFLAEPRLCIASVVTSLWGFHHPIFRCLDTNIGSVTYS